MFAGTVGRLAGAADGWAVGVGESEERGGGEVAAGSRSLEEQGRLPRLGRRSHRWAGSKVSRQGPGLPSQRKLRRRTLTP